jgi:iron(III) transport system permease protein
LSDRAQEQQEVDAVNNRQTSVLQASPRMGGSLWSIFSNIQPAPLVWLLLVGVLLLLVAWPIGMLVKISFQDSKTGAFTLLNYVEAYSRPRYVQALINSVLLGACAAVASVVLALPMAWAVSRTNMPCKWLAWLAVLGAFVMPPYLSAIGWLLSASPQAGWINTTWMSMTGDKTALFDIYTFQGLVLVTSLTTFPMVFLFAKSALDMVSTEMEEAAAILGSPAWHTSLKVTLPLVWPSILGAVIIVFLESIALLGVPAILGIPARVNLVTTQLLEFFGHPIRIETAAAYSMPLLLVTVALILLQRQLLARKGYITQTGKGGERRPLQLGRWRWVLLAWCGMVAMLALFIPGSSILGASLTKSWASGFSLSSLTLANYWDVLVTQSMARSAIFNSFKFAFLSASLALVLALLVAYVVARRVIPFANLLAFLCMAPFVIPGIVMAIGFYAAYAPPPLMLYGTATLIVLAFAARFLPIAYGTTSAGIRAIHPEMEEAVRILGGGRLTAIRYVLIPLMKKTLFAAFLLVAIPATRELSAAIFLVAPQTRVMSVLIFDMAEDGRFEIVSAIGCIVLVTTTLLVWLGFKLIGRDFMTRSK